MATDDEIKASAQAFANGHKKEIARRIASTEQFPGESDPVSIFMAGSPGAGKTEASLELIRKVGPVLRVDPDELRSEFEDYNGRNAYLFQGAVSVLVGRILDEAFDKKQSFLLDGTLTNQIKARENIARSLKRKRHVQILFVYQDPCQAWQFVCAREELEGRHISIDTFVSQYFEARRVVNELKAEFGSAINIDLLIKNNDGSNRIYHDNIQKIDHHVPEEYDEGRLRMSIATMEAANALP